MLESLISLCLSTLQNNLLLPNFVSTGHNTEALSVSDMISVEEHRYRISVLRQFLKISPCPQEKNWFCMYRFGVDWRSPSCPALSRPVLSSLPPGPENAFLLSLSCVVIFFWGGGALFLGSWFVKASEGETENPGRESESWLLRKSNERRHPQAGFVRLVVTVWQPEPCVYLSGASLRSSWSK